MKELTDPFDATLSLIDQSQNFLITGTASADGDSIGSQLALRRVLLQLTAKRPCIIDIVNEESCPKRYLFLPDAEKIHGAKYLKKLSPKYDMAFVLDGGSERCGSVKPAFDASACKVLVDHHLYGSDESYDISLSDPNSSSTAEIVYNLLAHTGGRVHLDQQLAAQLYLAIIFDTGFFRFSLTTPKTMQIGAELIATGIDFSTIGHIGLFETSIEGKRLLGEVLARIKLENDGRIAWVTVSKSLVKEVGATQDEHEHIIQHLLHIDTVEACFLLFELGKTKVKASFRSKNKVDVGQIARELATHGDGGGHARASGCLLEGMTLKEAAEHVLNGISAALE